MAEKRGQATVFFLLAFVVFTAFSFLIYVKVSNIEKIVAEKDAVANDLAFAEPVKNYVQGCLENVAENSIGVVGIQGGYYDSPEQSYSSFLFSYSYHFDGIRNVMPTKKKIEEEIAKGVVEELPYCLSNFSALKERGINIDEGPIRAASTITGAGVAIDVAYPLKIRQGAKSEVAANFKTHIPVRLSAIYDTSKRINDMQEADPENVCLSCIIDDARSKDLNVLIFSYRDGDTFFEIIDNQSKLMNEPYSFIFGAKNEPIQ